MGEILRTTTQFQSRRIVDTHVKDPEMRTMLFRPDLTDSNVRANLASRLQAFDSVQTGEVLSELLSGIADKSQFHSPSERQAAVGIIPLVPVEKLIPSSVKGHFSNAVDTLVGTIQQSDTYPQEQVMDLLDAGLTLAPHFPKQTQEVEDLRKTLKQLTTVAPPEKVIHPNVQIEEILTEVTDIPYIPGPLLNDKGKIPKILNPDKRHAVLSVYYANPTYDWTVARLVQASGITKSTVIGIIYRNGIKLGYKGAKPRKS